MQRLVGVARGNPKDRRKRSPELEARGLELHGGRDRSCARERQRLLGRLRDRNIISWPKQQFDAICWPRPRRAPSL